MTTDEVSGTALIVALVTLVVAVATAVTSVVIARVGWTRDQLQRDHALQAECAKALSALVQARIAPLSTLHAWDLFLGMSANEYHIAAIASMLSVSESRRDDDLVSFVADQAKRLEDECVRYRKSGEHTDDGLKNELGIRRAALANTAAMLQDDILTWQMTGSRQHMRSFSSHYASQLIGRRG